MKHLKIIITGLGVVAVSCLHLSCSKQTVENISTVESDFNNKAIVQVFVATVNATRNYIYVEGNQVTGNTLASGNIFPPTGIGFALTTGLKSFNVRDTLKTSTQLPLTFSQNFEPAKHYTVFMYDTISAPKQKTVLDNIPVVTDTTVRIRFANFLYNSSLPPAFDVFSMARNMNIATNVAYTDVTDYIAYPSRVPTDTLYVREAGTQNLLIKAPVSVLTPKRVYTFVLRGSYKGTRAANLYGNN